MRIAILSGGTVNNLQWLSGILDHTDRIICVDGGSKYASSLGIVPYMVIGDMDSICPDELDRFTGLGVIIKKYLPEKDDSDTALALAETLAQNPTEILFLGAVGTRLDHTMANIHLLRTAAKNGVQAKLINEHNEISLIAPGQIEVVEGSPGDLFSLLPLTTEVTGIRVQGARWPLEDATFEIGNPYGLSNRLAAERVNISIKSGLVLLIKVNEQGKARCG